MTGRPDCPVCHGRGYTLTTGKWRPCRCVRPTPTVQALMRRLHERPGRPFRIPWSK